MPIYKTLEEEKERLALTDADRLGFAMMRKIRTR